MPAPTMHGRPPRFTLLLATALALCALAWPAGAAAGAIPAAHSAAKVPLGGVNIIGLNYGSQAAQADHALAMALSVHAGVVRTEVPWAVLEPRAPGLVDARALAFVDRLVSDAAADRIGVILTVDGTPCWASTAPPSLLGKCSPTHFSQANDWPPSDPAPYALLVGFLAQRYGPKLTAIEIWNEPDQANELYFAGPEKPRRYAAILRAAYPAIKAANPSVPVLAGSLVGSNGVFLRQLYAAGIRGYYDGLSVHFYNLVLGSLRAIHETQLANGDSKPLWLNEFGWSSCWPRQRIQQDQACVTNQLQGANLADTFRALARTPYIAAEVVYELRGSLGEDFGVFNAIGARKPSFAPLAQVLSAPLSGRITPVTLRLRSHGGRVQASGSGPAGDYMGLEAFQGSTLRYHAIFTLDRFNRFSIALPRVLGTHLRVRVFQYWSRARAQRSI